MEWSYGVKTSAEEESGRAMITAATLQSCVE
jgi:hypothetical protein